MRKTKKPESPIRIAIGDIKDKLSATASGSIIIPIQANCKGVDEAVCTHLHLSMLNGKLSVIESRGCIKRNAVKSNSD
jgi:hypothetical protein